MCPKYVRRDPSGWWDRVVPTLKHALEDKLHFLPNQTTHDSLFHANSFLMSPPSLGLSPPNGNSRLTSLCGSRVVGASLQCRYSGNPRFPSRQLQGTVSAHCRLPPSRLETSWLPYSVSLSQWAGVGAPAFSFSCLYLSGTSCPSEPCEGCTEEAVLQDKEPLPHCSQPLTGKDAANVLTTSARQQGSAPSDTWELADSPLWA